VSAGQNRPHQNEPLGNSGHLGTTWHEARSPSRSEKKGLLRILAASRGTSVSQLLARMLRNWSSRRLDTPAPGTGAWPGCAREWTLAPAGTSAGARTASMSGNRRFVDTNILLYAHDDSAGAKRDKARALVEQLWESRDGLPERPGAVRVLRDHHPEDRQAARRGTDTIRRTSTSATSDTPTAPLRVKV